MEVLSGEICSNCEVGRSRFCFSMVQVVDLEGPRLWTEAFCPSDLREEPKEQRCEQRVVRGRVKAADRAL